MNRYRWPVFKKPNHLFVGDRICYHDPNQGPVYGVITAEMNNGTCWAIYLDASPHDNPLHIRAVGLADKSRVFHE